MMLSDQEIFEQALAAEYLDEDPYSELREILTPEYAALPSEDIEEYLESLGLVAEDVEGILSGIRRVAGVLRPALSGALQGGSRGGVTGAVTGAIQGALGGGRSTSSPARRQSQPVTPVRSAGGPPTTTTTVQPATADLLQLLQTIFSPEVVQALVSMLLNLLNDDEQEALAQSHVSVGGTLVPDSAIPIALMDAAERFAAEFNLAMPGKDEGVPRYLLDAEGEYRINPANPSERVDPVNPEHRAAVVLELLNQAADTEEVAFEDEWNFWLEQQSSNMSDTHEEALQDAWDKVEAHFAEDEI